jgi:glycosyltransferase involved in cell wall biosynthesis
MKSVCVLLPWSVSKDSRAQRTARTMARHSQVDVYFVPGHPGDTGGDLHRGTNVRLIPVPHATTRLDWALRHSLFYLETKFLSDAVEAGGARYDLVYAHDLQSAYPARRIVRKQGAKVLYDVHDLAIETINQGFPEKAPFHKRIKYALARWIMRTAGARWEGRFARRADLVATTTQSCLVYLQDRYGLKGGLVLPNYPEYREVERTGRLYEDCGIPRGSRIALYHGVFGRGRFLRRIVASSAHLAEGNVLVLVGNGHLDAELKAIAAGPRFRGKVFFHDFVPYDDLLPLASAASLGLILIDHINLSKKYALANKLTEYMASGVAVLGSDSPENRRILVDADAGYLYQVTTPEALGAHINSLLAKPEELAEKGRNGRRAFRDRYHWEACEPLFEKAFLDLIGGP